MTFNSDRAVIYLVIVGAGVAISLFQFFMRSAKGKEGDRALVEGDLEQALAAYRKQLLGVLELGPGSMNKENPRIFLSDCREEGMEVLEKIKAAYVMAGETFDDSPYHQLVAKVETLVADKSNFGLTNKLKGPAKTAFQGIRENFRVYIKGGMSAGFVSSRSAQPEPPVSPPSSIASRPDHFIQSPRSNAGYRPVIKSGALAKKEESWTLVLYHDGNSVATHPLAMGSYTVGRHEDSDFRINDPAVSRRHLTIRVDDLGRVELKDEGSSNGTWKNGRDRISTDAPGQGNWYQMGRSQLLFQREGGGEGRRP